MRSNTIKILRSNTIKKKIKKKRTLFQNYEGEYSVFLFTLYFIFFYFKVDQFRF